VPADELPERSPYRDPARTPIQALRNDATDGRIEVFAEFAAGLRGLEGFDFAWVLSWLDRAEPAPADGQVVPLMLGHTGERVGLFATRHPARPNPIGLSVVRVTRVDGSGLSFRGVDLCHGTPVLDVKPWQQDLDIPGYRDGSVGRIRGGWYDRTGAATAGQLYPDR
jgi:tRNA-Thr(GGU) m(6)t(6)A37 methyltransferase TsaA